MSSFSKKSPDFSSGFVTSVQPIHFRFLMNEIFLNSTFNYVDFKDPMRKSVVAEGSDAYQLREYS